MRALSRITALILLVMSITCLPRTSFSQESKKQPSGSVGGRVTSAGKPLPRALVLLTLEGSFGPNRNLPSRAITDEEGRYRLTGVAAGSYTIIPFTPTFVVPTEGTYGQQGKALTLAEGEEVTGLDFSLIRGAVISGRVTDSDGRPVIDQRVNIMRVDERGQRSGSPLNAFMFSTDDRGAYRVYGLSPGRYKVSVGDSPDSGMVRVGFGGGIYARTFHPDVTDESRAEVIDLTAGGEATGVDIKLGRASNTFVATGRIIDADSGKPLANLQYGHGAIVGQSNIGAFAWTDNRSNDNGEFRIEGLAPGRFAAFVVSTEQTEFYSEPAVFEVSDSNVSGIEIKVRRGSSISGVAEMDGAADADTQAKMSKLELRAFVRTEDVSPPSLSAILINPDGSFRISGLHAGKVRIVLGGYPPQKGFTLLRVERDGAVQPDGVEVHANEAVSGVRVVVGYGTGVVRGEVTIQGGQLTSDMRLGVSAHRVGDEAQVINGTGVDARGHFSLEGLRPGEYEISVRLTIVKPPAPGGAPSPVRVPPRMLAKQNVNVSNGNETQVTLVADLGAKDKEGEK